MSELLVIGYENAEKAEAARDDLLGMAREYLVDVSDAVVAVADDKGNVKLNQMVNLWTLGASGGAFWGLIIGLLFMNPLLGVLAGAASGGLAGALSDYGINDKFMKNVSEVLKPGQAALFIMARQASSERVLERLSNHGGRVIRTNLDRSKEATVRAMFEKVRQEEEEREVA